MSHASLSSKVQPERWVSCCQLGGDVIMANAAAARSGVVPVRKAPSAPRRWVIARRPDSCRRIPSANAAATSGSAGAAESITWRRSPQRSFSWRVRWIALAIILGGSVSARTPAPSCATAVPSTESPTQARQAAALDRLAGAGGLVFAAVLVAAGGEPVVGGRRGTGRGDHRRPVRHREHHRDRPDREGGAAGFLPAVVQALWTLRAAAFGLDMAAVAVALIGLSRAAAAMRLIPSWLALTAWPGAACLLIAAVFTVALADGGPWLAVGLVGFIVWVVFVITASVSLLRGRQIP